MARSAWRCWCRCSDRRARVVAGQSVAAARAAFVVGADHAFVAATLFVGATVLVLAVAIRGRRAVARAAATVAVPSWVRELDAPATRGG